MQVRGERWAKAWLFGLGVLLSPLWAQAAFVPALQLRGALPQTAARLEYVLVDANTRIGHTVVMTGNLALGARWQLFTRWALLAGRSKTGDAGAVYSNLLVGASLAVWKNKQHAISLTAAVAPPIGASSFVGGVAEAMRARNFFDNSLFALNDLSLSLSADWQAAWRMLTAQLEFNVIEALRLKNAATQPDRWKTNLTMGLFLGWQILDSWSAGAELRYQRFLSTPFAVAMDATGQARDNLNLGVGTRLHLRGLGVRWRVGLSYARYLDAPHRSNVQALLADVAALF